MRLGNSIPRILRGVNSLGTCPVVETSFAVPDGGDCNGVKYDTLGAGLFTITGMSWASESCGMTLDVLRVEMAANMSCQSFISY